MEVKQSSSGIRPESIDTTSSPTTVYVRENIQETVIETEMSGQQQWFVYTEKQYERREWEDLQAAQYVIDLEYELTQLKIEGGLV